MQELSKKLGFDGRTMSSVAARHQHITTTTLGEICRILGCRPEEVFDFTEKEPEHRRVYIRKDWQYSSEDYVVVNWEKLLADIKSAGYSETGLSKAMGKSTSYLGLRKNRKYTKKSVLKEIVDFLGRSTEEYI